MILIEELFKVHILLDFNGHATQSSVSTNLMFSQSFFMHQCCNTKAKEGLVDHPVVLLPTKASKKNKMTRYVCNSAKRSSKSFQIVTVISNEF